MYFIVVMPSRPLILCMLRTTNPSFDLDLSAFGRRCKCLHVSVFLWYAFTCKRLLKALSIGTGPYFSSDLTEYENNVGLSVELLNLRTNANADTLAPCAVAVLHRVIPPFTLASVFAAAATHAIQFIPRLACLCPPTRRHLLLLRRRG